MKKTTEEMLNGIDEKFIEEAENPMKKKSRRIIKYINGGVATAAAIALLIVFTPPGQAFANTVKEWFTPKTVVHNIEGELESETVNPAVTDKKDGEPGYVIYFGNEFTSEKANGVETIYYNFDRESYMQIRHEAKDYKSQFEAELFKQKYESRVDCSDSKMLNSQYVGCKLITGKNWDDRVNCIFCVDDSKGGCFVITYSYILEASEGLCVHFDNMLNTFEIIR